MTGQEAIGKRVSASGYKKKVFNVKTMKRCNYLPKEVDESSWLEIFKAQLSLKPCFQFPCSLDLQMFLCFEYFSLIIVLLAADR